MRRTRLIVGVLAWTLALSGCISVHTRTTRIVNAREVVPVGEDVYVIDKVDGQVWRVDLSTAQPFGEDYEE